MTARDIYERVSLTAPIWQRPFMDRLTDTICELDAMYGAEPRLLYAADADGEYPSEPQTITSLDDELECLPLYLASLADNILYLSGAGEAYKSEFLQKARAAWVHYWNADAKGRKIKSTKGGRRHV